MATSTSTRTQTAGIANHAMGAIRTTSASAAALTITVGFVPRLIRIHNVTDRISDEWYDGMDELAIFETIVGIATKLDADAGVTDTDFVSLWTPASASLADLDTSLTGILAKLDDDAGVTGTDYESLWAPSASVASLRASIAGMNAKLDADGGVTDTNYASLWDMPSVSINTAAAGTRTFDKVAGILNNLDGTFTVNATVMVASKSFVWEALG